MRGFFWFLVSLLVMAFVAFSDEKFSKKWKASNDLKEKKKEYDKWNVKFCNALKTKKRLDRKVKWRAYVFHSAATIGRITTLSAPIENKGFSLTKIVDWGEEKYRNYLYAKNNFNEQLLEVFDKKRLHNRSEVLAVIADLRKLE